jgi:hypothetical protein
MTVKELIVVLLGCNMDMNVVVYEEGRDGGWYSGVSGASEEDIEYCGEGETAIVIEV